MKKRAISGLVISLILITLTNTSNAVAKVFKNCSELNRVYPGGVARTGAINLGGKTKLIPKYDDALYNANQKSDRDQDGIACEK